jgi:hypothetical protein
MNERAGPGGDLRWEDILAIATRDPDVEPFSDDRERQFRAWISKAWDSLTENRLAPGGDEAERAIFAARLIALLEFESDFQTLADDCPQEAYEEWAARLGVTPHHALLAHWRLSSSALVLGQLKDADPVRLLIDEVRPSVVRLMTQALGGPHNLVKSLLRPFDEEQFCAEMVALEETRLPLSWEEYFRLHDEREDGRRQRILRWLGEGSERPSSQPQQNQIVR